MVNWINNQRAIATANDPPYIPYRAHKLSETPWIPPTCEHQADRTRWIAYSRQARRTASPPGNEYPLFPPLPHTVYHRCRAL